MSVWPSADPEHPNPLKPFSIGDLLPQSGNMILLDKLLDVGENRVVAELTVRDDGLFSGPGATVPAWVGLEYMAQTVAAYSGYRRRCAGLDVDLGFLLGTRYYQCSVSDFPCGVRLRASAEKLMDGGNDMSVFDCRLDGEGIHAEAILNVFLPRHSGAYLAGKGV